MADFGRRKQEGDQLIYPWRNGKNLNHELYEDILPENYKTSYGNPVYACEKLGEYGKDFTFLYAELRGAVVYAHEKRMWDMTVLLELFLEVYGAFSQEELPTEEELEGNSKLLCQMTTARI